MKTTMRRTSLSLALAGVLVLALGLGVAWGASAERSTSAVAWTWGEQAPGWSTLVRTDSGVSANYHTEGVPSGHVVTMWFIVFNNPAACNDSPCSIEDLIFNKNAEGDFLIGAGSVLGGSGVSGFGGSLNVGDTSGSGFFEIGMPERAVGLTNPRGAEVHLALHSHGPKLSGQALKSQISSYTGGCEVFLGNEFGIADGPDALPSAEGECTTFQASIHE